MRAPSRPLLLVLSLLSVTCGPLFAGDLVIPVANNQTLQDLSYSTRLWVANPTSDAQTFKALFFGAGTDGTADPAGSTLQTAAPGVTLVYGGVVTRAARDARVAGHRRTQRGRQARNPTRRRLLGSTDIPSITCDTAFAAPARRFTSQASERAAQSTGERPISTTLTPRRRNVLQFLLRPTAARSPTPSRFPSHRANAGICGCTADLGQSNIADVRLKASCDHAFGWPPC